MFPVFLMSTLLRVFAAIAAHALVKVALASPFPHRLLTTSTLANVSNGTLSCNDVEHCRTMWEIVWSCVTTISLCTWVSYHPELPNQRFTRARMGIIRVFTVCISFLIPELMMLKAVRQWLEVREYKSPF